MPRRTPRDHARAALNALDRHHVRRGGHDTGHSRCVNSGATDGDDLLDASGYDSDELRDDDIENTQLVDPAYSRLLRQLAGVPDSYLFDTRATARLLRRSRLTLATWRSTRVGPGGLTPPAFVRLHNRKIFYRA